MRLIILNIIVIAFILMSNAMHPVHVSVTNIDFNPKQKAFNISIKLFLDDFQGVILKNNNVDLNLEKPNVLPDADDYIKNYIQNNVKITINNSKFSQKKMKFIRKEISEGALWLYFTYQLPGKIETIQVENNLLNDYYPDMTNLVIMKYKELENGYTLNKHNTFFKIPS
ncbi:MAG: hypothetical protein COX07_04560 [Bacteroidetes bacterium CG23_combo_of_CG06-09_8_20_14_all_32_9]|nr:MAG: hypothetical protein COX07_04560 [Bacteroidetes bacterium CG23_combo_of_CG06-09_8_20_14_all_32_9]